MADTVRVKGLSELRRELKTLPAKLQKKVIRRSVAAAAKVVLTKAKSTAPRRTGALRRAIARRSRSSRGERRNLITQSIYVRSGSNRTAGQKKRGDDAFYWYMQEFGYRAVGRSQRKGRKKIGRLIPGRKFMSRAFESSSGRAIVTFRRTFQSELRQYRGSGV